ncbi:MAG: coenzyme F420-0:L-glutamate ligase [bacterium]|nr:coenzyme F420-0:L-glutamate ligase [bacterium]
MLEPNAGKKLEAVVDGVTYLRLPIKTRLIETGDNLLDLLKEYVAPHIQADDMLFVSEKVVCITQNRMILTKDVVTSPLARFLSGKVRNYAGTPQFRGLGHGTAPAMQLLIEEAGYIRTLFAALVSAITRPLGIKGAFYYLVGKLAKSIDCPMSWTLEPYTKYAKLAPLKPNEVARAVRDKFDVETVIVDANYRGAFSLGKSSSAISEKFIRELLHDNPAGQDSEMTPFFLIRQAYPARRGLATYSKASPCWN